MARKRNQHGSIRVLSRRSGDVFEYRYYKTRTDGERVPANFVVGTVDELKTEGGFCLRLLHTAERVKRRPRDATETRPDAPQLLILPGRL